MSELTIKDVEAMSLQQLFNQLIEDDSIRLVEAEEHTSTPYTCSTRSEILDFDLKGLLELIVFERHLNRADKIRKGIYDV